MIPNQVCRDTLDELKIGISVVVHNRMNDAIAYIESTPQGLEVIRVSRKGDTVNLGRILDVDDVMKIVEWLTELNAVPSWDDWKKFLRTQIGVN